MIKGLSNTVYILLLEHSRLTPFTIPFIYLMLFIVTWDLRNLYIVGLVFFNMILNSLLKHGIRGIYKLINTESIHILGRGYRPLGAKSCSVSGSNKMGVSSQTFGMPSGHAQIIWSLAAYYIFYLYDAYKYTNKFKIIYPVAVIAIILTATFVSYSRVVLGCHTPQQIILGGVIGFGIGSIAYYIEPTFPELN
jgi:membrane-associated phospholipid phosphatase